MRAFYSSAIFPISFQKEKLGVPESRTFFIDCLKITIIFFKFRISPVGISSVICAKILSVSNLALVMSQLAMFIITVVSGIFLYQFTILPLIYFVIVQRNPFRFWWGMFQSWMTAFATAST